MNAVFKLPSMQERFNRLGIVPKDHYNIPNNIQDTVILYVDDSEESQEAINLLESHGIDAHVVKGGLDPAWDYPLAQFHSWDYEGIENIHVLLLQMEYYGDEYVKMDKSSI